MIARLKTFLKDKSGVTAIEYGLIAALIGVAIIGGATALGGGLDNMFNTVETQVSDAAANAGGGASPTP